MKRDYQPTHTQHTHTPEDQSSPPPPGGLGFLKKNFFRPPGGRGEIINRVCMSVCMVYGLDSPK